MKLLILMGAAVLATLVVVAVRASSKPGSGGGICPAHRGSARALWLARGRAVAVAAMIVVGAGSLGALAAQGGHLLATAGTDESSPSRPSGPDSSTPTAPVPQPSPTTRATTVTPAPGTPTSTPTPDADPTTSPTEEATRAASGGSTSSSTSTESPTAVTTDKPGGKPTSRPTQSQGKPKKP